MIKSLFWIFLGIIIYAYLGYTLLLWVIFLVKRWVCKRKIIPEITKDNLPEVTLFISAYNEKEIIPIKKKGGRKPIADKKVLLRLYILQSVVDSHGGTEIAQEKCTKFLNETFFNIIFT